MTSALVFLGVAIVIAVVGGTIVAIVHRSGDVAPRTAADEFRQVMDALAPEEPHRTEPLLQRAPRPGRGPVQVDGRIDDRAPDHVAPPRGPRDGLSGDAADPGEG